MLDLRSVLNKPWMYRLYQRFARGKAYWVYVQDYVKPTTGDRIFDIGCGPGDILELLHDVSYVGVDRNPYYIQAAQAQFGTRGVFRCEAVLDIKARDSGVYDIVMANALFHHISDAEVYHLLGQASQLLKPDGRLVTLDGCFVPQQSAAARWLLRKDRGQFIRSPEAYASLARTEFTQVACHVRHDLMRIPYTLCILVCKNNG